jgi:hypothetical protein
MLKYLKKDVNILKIVHVLWTTETCRQKLACPQNRPFCRAGSTQKLTKQEMWQGSTGEE